MTEEKEAIEYFIKRMDICLENADICDENNFDEEAICLRKELALIEIVLNLIQRQDRQIQKLKNKNKDLLRKLRNRVKEVNKLIKYSTYKKEFSRLNAIIKQKDRQIDLMAKYIDINDFDINCSSLCVHEDCQEDCIKQYFEGQAKEV